MDIDRKLSPEDVIAKLKDDGDFDRLRLQIIRKLKDNEDLRSSIVSIVKQSSTLNQPGVETMKPRQLSDAIYGEVGDEVKSKISDGLWEIIRSGDGMKSEITETVESVYHKLLKPNGKGEGGSSSPQQAITVLKEADSNSCIAVLASDGDELLPDNEPNEPPGFSITDYHHNNNHVERHKEEPQQSFPNESEPRVVPNEGPFFSKNVLKPDGADDVEPPGYPAIVEEKQPCDVSDDDPDLPPGFV